MVIYRKPSQPLSPVGVEGYVLNMLTVAEWRGKGIASAIMRELLAWAREAGGGTGLAPRDRPGPERLREVRLGREPPLHAGKAMTFQRPIARLPRVGDLSAVVKE